MKRFVTKSIDGVSPLPDGDQRSPLIHSISVRLEDDLRSETPASVSGGVFGASPFGRSLQPASLDVEQERFVQSRPLI